MVTCVGEMFAAKLIAIHLGMCTSESFMHDGPVMSIPSGMDMSRNQSGTQTRKATPPGKNMAEAPSISRRGGQGQEEGKGEGTLPHLPMSFSPCILHLELDLSLPS